jgi:hypothetical protein
MGFWLELSTAAQFSQYEPVRIEDSDRGGLERLLRHCARPSPGSASNSWHTMSSSIASTSPSPMAARSCV